MKKLLALLLALMMVFPVISCSAKPEPETAPEAVPEAEPAPEAAPPAVETVTYFCTVGAYLDTLLAAVEEWNAGAGAEKGVCIEVNANSSEGASANEALMQAGTFHDLSDGCSQPSWVLNGWVKDLYEVAGMDPELDGLIQSYEPYFCPGMSEVNGILTALPWEVVPIKLAVNTDLLEQYGYGIPATVDEMADIAIGIYGQSGGEAYGWGGCSEEYFFRRLLFKATSNSTGRGHWDPNTGTYDFSPFQKIVEVYARMVQAGAVLGLDDLDIDAIRAEFAAGKVAFFTAPAYDIAVYTARFPAACSWTVIDFPAYDESGAQHKGVYLNRVNMGIIAPAFDGSSEAHRKAVIEAFKFLNSDELAARIYANGGMIPCKPEIIERTEVLIDVPQWALMADISNYTSEPIRPDDVISLEGDDFETVMREVVHGSISFDEAVEDLNVRYNAAAMKAVDDPNIDMDLYIYEYSTD